MTDFNRQTTSQSAPDEVKAPRPQVGVVLLTLNQKEDTVRCIESLQRADYPDLYILLVDNGSTDGTAEVVAERFPSVEVVRSSKNLGEAGGRKLGARTILAQSKCEFILIMDNDTVVSPNFLAPLVAALRSYPNVGLVSPMVHSLREKGVIDEAGGCKVNFITGSTQRRGAGELDQGQYDDPATAAGLVPGGVCTLSRREVIEETGGFDELFNPYGFADLDYSLRVRAAGWTTRFVPESLIFHKGSKTGFGSYSPEYAAIKGRNMRRFLRRHSTTRQRVAFYLVLPFLALRTILREIRRGNWRAPFRLIAGFVRS